MWIDALSISQTDLAEKADQVAMIARIFKQAVRVLDGLASMLMAASVSLDLIVLASSFRHGQSMR